MFRAATISVLCASCATTGLDQVSSGRLPASQVAISSTPLSEGASHEEIVPVDPKLPSVDEIGARVRDELGDTATANLKLCVQPSGRLAQIELARRSMLPDFDRAVLRDVSDWQFKSTPGPAAVERCELITVVYHPSPLA